MHQPMTKKWDALADQPDELHVLTDAILEMQRRVEAQETRRDSTPPNGHEEALTQIVDELGSLGRAEPNRRKVILRRFRSLCRNRSRRERSRQQLLDRPPDRLDPPDPAVVAEANDLMRTAQARTPPNDWALLNERAQGFTFEEIAAREGASLEALRSRVCRRRAVPLVPLTGATRAPGVWKCVAREWWPIVHLRDMRWLDQSASTISPPRLPRQRDFSCLVPRCPLSTMEPCLLLNAPPRWGAAYARATDVHL
jgi:hypothetical protein